MASEWQRRYAHGFFLTVARNYQPIPGTELHQFDSHDDSVLFLDKSALVEYLPRLSQVTGGYIWVMLVTEDIQGAARRALTGLEGASQPAARSPEAPARLPQLEPRRHSSG